MVGERERGRERFKVFSGGLVCGVHLDWSSSGLYYEVCTKIPCTLCIVDNFSTFYSWIYFIYMWFITSSISMVPSQASPSSLLSSLSSISHDHSGLVSKLTLLVKWGEGLFHNILKDHGSNKKALRFKNTYILKMN